MKRTIALLLCCIPLSAISQQELTLSECIAHATSNNVQVKITENARQRQANALNTARYARLPQLSANASQSFNFGRGLTAENTYVSRNTASTSWGLNASMPLFTGGQIPYRRKQAEIDLYAATADLESLKENLAIQVAQAYLQVLYQEDVVEQAKLQLQLSQKQEHRIARLLQLQKASGVELAQAHSRTAQDELNLAQAESNQQLALLTLSQLIEFPTPENIHLSRPDTIAPPPPTDTPLDIFTQYVSLRPALQAAELRIKSAEKGIQIAKSGYMPSLSLGVGVGSSFYKTKGFSSSPFDRQMRDNFATNIGLSLNIPIFNRFATRNAVREACLNLQQQQWQADDTRKTIYKEIQTAWYNASTAQTKWLAAKEAECASREAYLLMEKKYENGKANATEYEEAKTNLYVSATGRISAFYEYLFRAKILDFYRGKPLE